MGLSTPALPRRDLHTTQSLSHPGAECPPRRRAASVARMTKATPHVHGPDCDHDHDHIRAPYVRETPKIGRNEPCPCGSGKKFKRCHGAAL